MKLREILANAVEPLDFAAVALSLAIVNVTDSRLPIRRCSTSDAPGSSAYVALALTLLEDWEAVVDWSRTLQHPTSRLDAGILLALTGDKREANKWIAALPTQESDSLQHVARALAAACRVTSPAAERCTEPEQILPASCRTQRRCRTLRS